LSGAWRRAGTWRNYDNVGGEHFHVGFRKVHMQRPRMISVMENFGSDRFFARLARAEAEGEQSAIRLILRRRLRRNIRRRAKIRSEIPLRAFDGCS
jgi:hypothetical protein